MDFEKATLDDLHKYLISIGKVDERLPECPDLEEMWPQVLEGYLPDGIREFQEYPVTSLGWIMYIGMALARRWDTDWENASKQGGRSLYETMRDEKGYDNLDDNILLNLLGLDEKEAEEVAKNVGECASRTLGALQRSHIEAATEAAAKAYVGALHALYTMGVAYELNALGYHMTPLNISPK